LGPLVTGAVQIVGALLTLFSPRVGGSLVLLAAASSLMLVSDLNGNIFGALTVCWLLAVPGILALLGSTGSNISQSRSRAQSVSGNPSIQG
jgi:hypothetical protein